MNATYEDVNPTLNTQNENSYSTPEYACCEGNYIYLFTFFYSLVRKNARENCTHNALTLILEPKIFCWTPRLSFFNSTPSIRIVNILFHLDARGTSGVSAAEAKVYVTILQPRI